jgi:hypothetical protein
MEIQTGKRRRTNHSRIEELLDQELILIPSFSVDILDLEYINFLRDYLTDINVGTKFVFKENITADKKLLLKNGIYTFNYNINTNDIRFKIEFSNDKIILFSDNLNNIQSFINDIDLKMINKRNEQENIKLFINDNSKWTEIEGCKKRNLNSIFLNEKLMILNRIKTFLTEKELYNKLGIPYKLNILFYGLPGTGKTSLIIALASKLNYNICIITSNNSEINSDKDLILVLSNIPKNSFLLIEDFEILSQKINLTSILDGIAVRSGLITFLTSNNSKKQDIVSIDSLKKNNPLIRPSRIDIDVKFNWAKKEQIIGMYNKFISNTENGNIFYEKIKNNKITISLLQDYFFKYREEGLVMENIEEIKKKSKELFEKSNNYYC